MGDTAVSLLTFTSRWAGRTQTVRMVKVREVAHPDRYGLAALPPVDAHVQLTEAEQMASAIATATRKLEAMAA